MNLPVAATSVHAHHDSAIVTHHEIIDGSLVLCSGRIIAWRDLDLSMKGLAAEFSSIPGIKPLMTSITGGRFVREDDSVEFFAYMQDVRGRNLLAPVFKAMKKPDEDVYDVDQDVASSTAPLGYFPPNISSQIAVRLGQMKSKDNAVSAIASLELKKLYAKAMPICIASSD